MTGEYDHLDREMLGHFMHRIDKRGDEVNPSPLDGARYCEADTHKIGTSSRGMPNRVMVAAFTGDREYLTLHGAKDPTEIAERLKRDSERASFAI